MSSVDNKPEILSHLGVGSGINTTALIDSLVDADTAGVKEDIINKTEKFEAEISAFSTIKNNIKVVEAGAQGEHKLQRGYIPTKTVGTNIFIDPSNNTIADLCNKSLQFKNINNLSY